ncbi:MAG: hypothetical protein ACOYB4_06640 [Methyloceanibacter sp.]
MRFLLILRAGEQRELSFDEIRAEFEALIAKLPWQDGFQPDDPPIQMGTYDDFLARDYIESIPLDMNVLSFAARYARTDDKE